MPRLTDAQGFRIRWDRRAVRELRTEPGVQEHQRRIAHDMATVMRSVAPRDTEGLAFSIDVRPDRRLEYALDVGWDAAHAYGVFPEYGTEHQAKQWFAHHALFDFDYGP